MRGKDRLNLARASSLDRSVGSGVKLLDFRGGRLVEAGSDDHQHRQAGALFLRWWIYGVKFPNGARPNFWCIEVVIPGVGSIEYDLRSVVLGLANQVGARRLLQFASIDQDGRSVMEAGAGQHLGEIGRELHAAMDPRNDCRVRVSMPTSPGQPPREALAFDPRPAIHQVLRAFESKLAEEVKAGRIPWAMAVAAPPPGDPPP